MANNSTGGPRAGILIFHELPDLASDELFKSSGNRLSVRECQRCCQGRGRQGGRMQFPTFSRAGGQPSLAFTGH